MTDKFKVYAQVRATRQLAGDISHQTVCKADGSKDGIADWRKWREIEDKLNDIECELERMDLK